MKFARQRTKIRKKPILYLVKSVLNMMLRLKHSRNKSQSSETNSVLLVINMKTNKTTFATTIGLSVFKIHFAETNSSKTEKHRLLLRKLLQKKERLMLWKIPTRPWSMIVICCWNTARNWWRLKSTQKLKKLKKRLLREKLILLIWRRKSWKLWHLRRKSKSSLPIKRNNNPSKNKISLLKMLDRSWTCLLISLMLSSLSKLKHLFSLKKFRLLWMLFVKSKLSYKNKVIKNSLAKKKHC